MERVGRCTLKDDMVLEDLLVLSCEEDYEVCVPFLERGLDTCALTCSHIKYRLVII